MRKLALMLLLAGMLANTAASAAPVYEAIAYVPDKNGPTDVEVDHYQHNRFIFDRAVQNNDPCDAIYPKAGENIAWLEARVILGLLDMHKATGNTAYLDKIVAHADHVFACRLDLRNATLGASELDTHRNLSTFKAWPSYSYNFPRVDTTHVSYSVHSAFFAYAVAKFVRFVVEQNLMQNLMTFQSKATEYLPLLQESLEAFDSERQNGIYIFPPATYDPANPTRDLSWKSFVDATTYDNVTNVVQPINMQVLMGLAFLEESKRAQAACERMEQVPPSILATTLHGPNP